MAYFYNYYYIGENNLTDDELNRHRPILLTFSKIKNGVKGETDRHMHTHLEIFYFENGQGYFECKNRIIPIKAHDVLVVNSKQVHMQYSKEKAMPLTYYCFAVDNLHLEGKDINCISNQGYLLHSFYNSNNLIYRNIKELLSKLMAKKYSFINKVQAYFTQILIDIIRMENRSASKNADPPCDHYLNDLKEYMLNHYTEDLNLESLAKMCFMNKSYFLHQFKKQFNISPIRYLNLVRIEKAKLLLAETDASITKIASDIGISNPVYFTELFKKTIGISPSEYRKIIQRHSSQ